jgi:hypothetical protein
MSFESDCALLMMKFVFPQVGQFQLIVESEGTVIVPRFSCPVPWKICARAGAGTGLVVEAGAGVGAGRAGAAACVCAAGAAGTVTVTVAGL